MQERGNLRRVLEAQTYEGEDADVCRQAVLPLRMYAHLWLQQGVEPVDEVGEEMQEHSVEVLVELLQLLLLQLRRLGNLEQLVKLLVLHLTVHHLTVVVEFVDILCTEAHEASDVFFFHAITLRQL